MTSQPSALPTPDAAHAFLMQEAYSRTFFEKLASAYGIRPTTADEAAWLTEIAGKIRVASAHEKEKQASAGQHPLQRINAELDAVLAQQGVTPAVKVATAVELDRSLHSAAAMLREDPRFYNSVLSLKTAEAEQIRQAYRPA